MVPQLWDTMGQRSSYGGPQLWRTLTVRRLGLGLELGFWNQVIRVRLRHSCQGPEIKMREIDSPSLFFPSRYLLPPFSSPFPPFPLSFSPSRPLPKVTSNFHVVRVTDGKQWFSSLIFRACLVQVTIWMGDCLWTGKLSPRVTNHLGQLSLPSLRGR